MGALHPVEQWLTLILAFGPFLLLGVVLWLRSREDDDEQADQQVVEDGGDVVASTPHDTQV
jgi:hypothetical protein